MAVTPFVNLSREPGDDWIGDGIAETVASDLETEAGYQVRDLDAVRDAVQEPGAAPPDVLSVGRALDVTWLVTGGYQRLGDQLRVTARLVNVTTGAVTRAATLDGVWEDLFELQDRIVTRLLSDPVQVADSAGDAQERPPLSARPPLAPLAPLANDQIAEPAATPLDPGVPVRRGSAGMAIRYDGPPPPRPPAVINRDRSGRATLRAVRLTSPLAIDGALAEAVYEDVPSVTDFIQMEPDGGALATEQTEVWVLFDDDNIYVSVRCWESHPERIVANDMRRDGSNVPSTDRVGFSFDTFYDGRNAYTFTVNAIGGRMDGEITNERGYNGDWNPVWEVAVDRFDGGWSYEAAVPFKSLRYRPGREQVWGIQVGRTKVWNNELSYITPLPYGTRGLTQMSLAPTLVGLEVPSGSANFEIKPYAITDLSTDRTVVPALENELSGDLGLDVKYGITQNLTADLTVNTDFAQVEADEQQVNLTRFSLFFPEKREFFLENRGIFAFGGAGTGPGPAQGASPDTPVLFYSRRIGLNEAREVPIDVGGRLTGRLGAFSVGILNIQASDEPASGTPATNFTVLRVKRDVFRRSSIGALFTGRSVTTDGTGSNEVYGVDGTFAFYDHLSLDTYWAQTRTPGISERDTSYLGRLDYDGDRYGVKAERLVVGDGFNPEVGFVRRSDIRRNAGQFRFSPRVRSSHTIRKLSWSGSGVYIDNHDARLETREWTGEFGVEFENSDELFIGYTDTYEFLSRPFNIAPGVVLPVGGYSFASSQAGFGFGPPRRVSGTVTVEHGEFFSGDRTALTVSGSLVELTPSFTVEPSVSVNWIDLVEGAFTTTLVGARTTYTLTPYSFIGALLQYNSSTNLVSANLRFRWEYHPGSELFVVYNEERDSMTRRFPQVENRSLIIKINRLFRF